MFRLTASVREIFLSHPTQYQFCNRLSCAQNESSRSATTEGSPVVSRNMFLYACHTDSRGGSSWPSRRSPTTAALPATLRAFIAIAKNVVQSQRFPRFFPESRRVFGDAQIHSALEDA